ncbi:MAG: caspase family protein [Sphaerochaeta sp.]|nr:caspase family protein [Sphaerochaeta sp.]
MKKAMVLTLLVFILLFQGCELFIAEAPLGSIHAIYVGLSYHGTDVNYLAGTLNDATELENCFTALCNKHIRPIHSYPLLQRGGAFESWGETARGTRYPIYSYDTPDTYATLPTKSNVLSVIGALKPLLTEKDLTIFSYSGHGLEGGSLVLAPSSPDDPTIFTSENRVKSEVLLSVRELLDALSALPGRQLLILDSCHCGSFVEGSGSSVSLIEKELFLDEALALYFSSDQYSPSLFVMAATTASNTSKEPVASSHIHGYFTEAVLDGLGWDHQKSILKESSPAMKKGVLTLDSLYAYVLENQDFPLTGTNPKRYQHPTISGGAYTLRLF